MLKSIFYARFHPEKGSTVLHQVPEGSIIPCPPSPTAQTPLFEYKSIADYIIPRREFCDRLICIVPPSSSSSSSSRPRHRIIGFPVCIHDDDKYERNDFIFNFCLVLDEDAPYAAYASVIRKLARLLRNLEEQGDFLSEEEERGGWVVAGEVGYGGGSKVYALCEMILEDLNNYCECMIPIDESNTVNLKLFPTRPSPPPIHTWHVPLSLVRFESLATTTWDLTVQRLIPHIDGVNSVARMAALADTDLHLTRRAVAHLLYYGCICLLDIFHFSAVYACTAEISVFFADDRMLDECRAYVATPRSPFGKAGVGGKLDAGSKTGTRTGSRLNPANSVDPSSRDSSTPVPSSPDLATTLRTGHEHAAISHFTSPTPHITTANETINLTGPETAASTDSHIPSRALIIDLYASLRQGLPLREWCLHHSHLLPGIDVRRLITFGKIKGFVYRCHKYAIALKPGLENYGAAIVDVAGANGGATATGVGGAAGGKRNRGGVPIHPDDPIANARMHERAWRKAAMSSGWSNPPLPKSGQLKEVATASGANSLHGTNGDVTPVGVGAAGSPGQSPGVAAAPTGTGAPDGTIAGAEIAGNAVGPPGTAAGITSGAAGGINGIGATAGAAPGTIGLDLPDAAMTRYLDGLHCLDEICTELKMAERDVVRRLKRASGGDVAFVYR